jgi:SAM-dependent methyltransferase
VFGFRDEGVIVEKSLRWEIAQKYEKNYWAWKPPEKEGAAKAGSLSWYSWAAGQLCRRIEGLIEKAPGMRILEVGAGPAGTISYVDWGIRVGVDPLASFFQEYRRAANFEVKGVHFCAAIGEHLPFRDASFGLVTMENVLDHCSDTERVLLEVHRVLDREGLLHFMVYIRTPWDAVG